MAAFHNILTGIDLSGGGQLTPAKLSPVAREVNRMAAWLAGKTAARLTFFAALNVTADALRQPSEGGRTLGDAAEEVLAGLVRSAREAGADAQTKLVLGSAADELLRQVQQGSHDLLLIGTRDLHGLRRVLFGSTAARLIHRCPCPVWVAKPPADAGAVIREILVSTDLGPAAQHALERALDLAQAISARVHVLHVVDYPVDHVWASSEPDPIALAYRRRVRGEAEQTLREQLARAGDRARGVDVQIHLTDMVGLADETILSFIRDHPIDLLALGMEGRSGFEGFLVGNTAERILPEVPCSLFSVRRAEAGDALA